MPFRAFFLAILILIPTYLGIFVAFYAPNALAEDSTQNHQYSPMLFGALGLNTIPNARMAPAGTISAGVSTLDPYVHGFLGFQMADPLFIAVRQSAEVSNINASADRLYPGVDLKLQLMKENRYRPAVALGLQSAIGHKRMAGEYLALSKRYRDFDFTAGMGWGRFGSAGHIDNPLKSFSGHFGSARSLDGEMPNDVADWFTGEKIGLFGGVEYFTSFVDGLSVKLDWGADRYVAERTAFGFNAPAPWSAGLAYQPVPWANMSVAMQGTDKVMGRLSVQGSPDSWPFKNHQETQPEPLRRFRTELALPGQMEVSANSDGIMLYDASRDMHFAQAKLHINAHTPMPLQLGQTVRHMANHAGPAIEELYITPTLHNLRGPTVRLIRSDFEQALAQKQGSPAEIWRNAAFITHNEKPEGAKEESSFRLIDYFKPTNFRLILDNDFSLSEEDSGTLYRTALIIEKTAPKFFGLLTSGAAVRINISDNLDNIRKFRPRVLLPVRSNVDEFADTRVSVERLYTSFTHSFNPNLHTALTTGYLEEMYAGFGGEILYRPFGKRFALGAESWLALKRDPDANMHMGLNGDHLLSGHVNAWYDIPNLDLTVQGRAGRYLAEDVGASLALQKDFKNGAKLEGFVTVSDNADFDVFGGTTHAYNGIRFSLPLGSIKHVPQGSEIRVKIAPQGRDIGQSIDNPLPLYEATESFSKDHLIAHWNSVLE